jgi:hypothetical protein
MNLVLAFLAGMFLTNSIPHIVSGIQGNRHMTPLSKESSAIINIVWGYINLVFGALLLNFSGGDLSEVLSFNDYSIAFLGGSLFMALGNAWLFSNPNARFPWFK